MLLTTPNGLTCDWQRSKPYRVANNWFLDFLFILLLMTLKILSVSMGFSYYIYAFEYDFLS